MIELLLIFTVGFTSVFAMGFQSRNVNHGNYGWAAGTSFFIAVAQASIWKHITAAGAGWTESFVYGLSGSLAITSSMWVHQRFISKRTKP
jgi:hypothetical protein